LSRPHSRNDRRTELARHGEWPLAPDGRLVVFSTQTPPEEHTRFGCANVKIHTEIAKAARARDSERVRALMKAHMEEASEYVKRLDGRLDGRLILDSEMAPRPRPLS
jgi:DNA-binding GntR family transcriptional regulator